MFTNFGNNIGRTVKRLRGTDDDSLLKKEILRSPDSTSSLTSSHEKQHEKILSSNKLEKRKGSLGGNCGDSSLVKLKDDGFGVFKPYTDYNIEGRKKQIQNERAAYIVDLFLGLELVPPTVVRTFPTLMGAAEEIGSLQQFIEESKTGTQIGTADLGKLPEGERMKLSIFDFMINNTDRHTGNYLVKEDKIYAIDHGISFGFNTFGQERINFNILSDKDPDIGSDLISNEEFWEKKLPSDCLQKLKKFHQSETEQTIFSKLFEELIGKEKADQYLKRINIIIASLDETGKLDRPTFKKLITKASEEQQSAAFANFLAATK